MNATSQLPPARRFTGVELVMRAAFLLPPVAALLIAAPMATAVCDAGMPMSAVHAAVASPFFLGLLCLPAYLLVALKRTSAAEESALSRWWIRVSFIVAGLCAIAGTLGGTMMILFAPPSLISLWCVAQLLWEFERQPTAGVR